jgi:hypothetical protein
MQNDMNAWFCPFVYQHSGRCVVGKNITDGHYPSNLIAIVTAVDQFEYAPVYVIHELCEALSRNLSRYIDDLV